MIENSSRTKLGTSSVIFWPRTDDRLWRANVATPTSLCSRMRAATIRGRLLFLWWTSRCGYYSRAATIWGAASIRINTVIIIVMVAKCRNKDKIINGVTTTQQVFNKM